MTDLDMVLKEDFNLSTTTLLELDDVSLSEEILEHCEEEVKYNRVRFFTPYPFQEKFFKASSKHRSRMLSAGNRCGKSFSEAQEVSYHLTGKYPEWWSGHRFTHPPLIWCIGITSDSTRKVLQKELFGTESAKMEVDLGTGAIPRRHILLDFIERDGNVIKIAKVKWYNSDGEHKGNSTVEFRSTQQGHEVLMGPSIDYAWLDEESPRDSDKIYSQVLTRTATTNGLVAMTATPEQGLTSLVSKFMEDDTGHLYYQNATVFDAPHITEDVLEELKAGWPTYQWDMRMRGIPVMGSGLIYDVDEAIVRVDPIVIPEHWPKVAGMDLGISHDTAVVWSAWDRDTDTVYIYDCYHKSGGIPAEHSGPINERGSWIPVILPHDALQREKGSGRQVRSIIKDSGINAAYNTFHNPTTVDGKTNNSVEPGIMELLTRMKTGRLKVFSTCTRFFEELRRYHRKDGKIVKTFDDTIDAARYSVMSLLANRGLTLTEACMNPVSDINDQIILDDNY